MPNNPFVVNNTLAPQSRASMAALQPAIPAPIISTSVSIVTASTTSLHAHFYSALSTLKFADAAGCQTTTGLIVHCSHSLNHLQRFHRANNNTVTTAVTFGRVNAPVICLVVIQTVSLTRRYLKF
jgi:hypothetical protein